VTDGRKLAATAGAVLGFGVDLLVVVANFVVRIIVGGVFVAFVGLVMLDQSLRESCAGPLFYLDEVLGGRLLLRCPSLFCSGCLDAGLFCRLNVADGL
jgi:hypothetical protein